MGSGVLEHCREVMAEYCRTQNPSIISHSVFFLALLPLNVFRKQNAFQCPVSMSGWVGWLDYKQERLQGPPVATHENKHDSLCTELSVRTLLTSPFHAKKTYGKVKLYFLGTSAGFRSAAHNE